MFTIGQHSYYDLGVSITFTQGRPVYLTMDLVDYEYLDQAMKTAIGPEVFKVSSGRKLTSLRADRVLTLTVDQEDLNEACYRRAHPVVRGACEFLPGDCCRQFAAHPRHVMHGVAAGCGCGWVGAARQLNVKNAKALWRGHVDEVRASEPATSAEAGTR